MWNIIFIWLYIKQRITISEEQVGQLLDGNRVFQLYASICHKRLVAFVILAIYYVRDCLCGFGGRERI